MKSKISFLIFCTIFIHNTVFAMDAVNFRLSQANVQLPAITAWLDITDDNDKRIDDIKSEQLAVTIGSNIGNVSSVMPYLDTHKGTAYVFLVDISQSLKTNDFHGIQKSLTKWVDGMDEHDRVALISFGSQVKVLQDFSSDKTASKQILGKLKPTDKDTFLYEGVLKAYEIAHRQDVKLPKRRVIVVLTDGIDDAAGRVTKDEVFTHLSENRIPIYAIGFSLPPLTSDKENGLKELGILARTSGGHFIKANALTFDEAYEYQKKRIESSYEVSFNCNDCKSEGQLTRLNITFTKDNYTLNDGMDVRLLPQIKEVTEDNKSTQIVDITYTYKAIEIFNRYGYISWVLLSIFIISILCIILWIIKSRRHHHLNQIENNDEDDIQNEFVNHLDNKGTIKINPILKKYSISFTVITGTAPGQSFKINFNDSLIIGRAADSDLNLNDNEISAHHAEIKLAKGILAINDLTSTNGTYINGVPIRTIHYLQDGDRILIGRTEIRLNGLENDYAN
jgi:VWFA-related protein